MRQPISRWTSIVAMALGVGVIGGSVIGGIALAASDGPDPNPTVSESHQATERDDSGTDGVDDHDDDSRSGYDSDSEASDRDDDSGHDGQDDDDDSDDDMTATPTPSSDDDHPDDD